MSSPDVEPPVLYQAREPIFPRRVKGRYRSAKWVIMTITLSIYYIMPWLRWDRGPNLPDQAVLIDLANRRFFFFWIEIWPHEFYFIAGLLIMAGLGLFLFTSAFGRVWCGYTCPQTVWTDLFILTERWIEGDRNARVRLWNEKWGFRKWRLRLTKWTVWLVISVLTGGAWVFYFTDASTLLWDLLTFNAPLIAWSTIAVLTATTFVFGGFMREQICIYMCPWPRIQAAMMDENTLTVAYREWRGEPRGKLQKDQPTKSDGGLAGDCIDCLACVNVCPMGIDIRDGQQMECITCALCIDACDEVMDRIGKPRGLIDYFALHDETAERAGASPRPIIKHILRPRTVLYFTLWSGIGLALLVALLMRSPFDLNVTPARNPLYVTMSDGSIRNTYEVRLRNKQGNEHYYHVQASTLSGQPLEGLTLTLEGEPASEMTVPANMTKTQRVYLTADPDSDLAGDLRSDILLTVGDLDSGVSRKASTVFNGKEQP